VVANLQKPAAQDNYSEQKSASRRSLQARLAPFSLLQGPPRSISQPLIDNVLQGKTKRNEKVRSTAQGLKLEWD
jgi:hypothetical protein